MSAGDPSWEEVPANVLHLSGRDSALPDELVDRILRSEPVETGAAPEALALAGMVTTLRRPARPARGGRRCTPSRTCSAGPPLRPPTTIAAVTRQAARTRSRLFRTRPAS